MLLLADDGVDEVEDGGAHERRHIAPRRALGGGDEEDAAIEDGAPQVDGGAGLPEDGARHLRGGVVGETRLHGRERLGAVFPPPAPEVPRPPLQQVGIGDLLQDLLAELLVREQAQPVEDGVLLVRGGGRVGVGLVQGLHRLLEDGLHARTPLLPQPPGHAHDRVGGAVAVAEDAGVEEVDAGEALLRAEVHEPYLVDEGFWDVPEEIGHEVGVGVDDDDGVAVAPRRLLPQLVGDDVVHEGGLAHARAGHVELVTVEEVAREADGARPARRRLAHERALAHVPRGGEKRLRPRASHERRLVPRARRVPECGRLAHAEDTAAAEQSRAGRMQPLRVGEHGRYPARREARPQGMVEVAVGGGHPVKQLPRTPAVPLRVLRGEDDRDLDHRPRRRAVRASP